MERRTFLTGAVLLAAPLAAEAQPATKVARIGHLSPDLAARTHLYEAFRQGLRALGYVEGRNVVLKFAMPRGTSNGSRFWRPNWLRSSWM